MSKIVTSGGTVCLTIYLIPEDLLHEFSEHLVKLWYSGGKAEAVLDLMRKQSE